MSGAWTKYRPAGFRLVVEQRSATPGFGGSRSSPDRGCGKREKDLLIRGHGNTSAQAVTRGTAVGTDQGEQQGVEVRGGAEGVHGEHLAPLLQPLVNGGPQARQQDVALPQAVDVNGKRSEMLGEDQLQGAR